MPVLKCLLCNHTLDAATRIDDCCSPKPGDLSVCVSCGNVLMFCEDLSVQVATKEDLAKLDAPTLRMVKTLRSTFALMYNAEEGK